MKAIFSLALFCACWGWQGTGEHKHEPSPSSKPSEIKEICTWQDLKKELERRKVPFSEGFVKVAVCESGWSLDQGVGSVNNMFGMRSRPCHPTTDNGYAVYLSRSECLDDYVAWIGQAPPRQGEAFVPYLRRRGYNPSEPYYAYLSSITLP